MSDEPCKAQRWWERWYGSPPGKGWAIVADDGTEIAHFGDRHELEGQVRAIVFRHNREIGVEPWPQQR